MNINQGSVPVLGLWVLDIQLLYIMKLMVLVQLRVGSGHGTVVLLLLHIL